MSELTVIEICAGAGGQSLGLEDAGFQHVVAVDNDNDACNTLKFNRPGWNVVEGDVRSFSGAPFSGADLLAGGVPCPPFSIAGKQLGADDERDLFPEAVRLVGEVKPRAILLENVRGLASTKFASYREHVRDQLEQLGYRTDWRLLQASSYGVPQLRPRFILIGLPRDDFERFKWPEAGRSAPPTVGEEIGDLMRSRGWPGADQWVSHANRIAPTIVGGSKKHGGPDLGPTRARQAWRALGVDGLGLADEPPGPGFPVDGLPRLTVRMVARLQGFPDDWLFVGGKTTAHRQVGNAFPPPVARAVSLALGAALSRELEYAAN
jgi:DNA (cytosine-5)-methyltransferase 1